MRQKWPRIEAKDILFEYRASAAAQRELLFSLNTEREFLTVAVARTINISVNQEQYSHSGGVRENGAPKQKKSEIVICTLHILYKWDQKY